MRILPTICLINNNRLLQLLLSVPSSVKTLLPTEYVQLTNWVLNKKGSTPLALGLLGINEPWLAERETGILQRAAQ